MGNSSGSGHDEEGLHCQEEHQQEDDEEVVSCAAAKPTAKKQSKRRGEVTPTRRDGEKINPFAFGWINVLYL